MSVLNLLTTRMPGATIQSAPENAEFQQLVDLLAGTSTSKNAIIKYNHATDAPVALDQLGAGIIQEWKLSGTRKSHVTNNGSLSTVNQFISTLATGTKPIDVTSTTVCTNLNADLLDGQEGTYYLAAANITGIVSGASGGTGVANTGKTITLGGNLETSGANNVTLTSSGATNVTLPTTGTLATLAGSETFTNKKFSDSTCTFVDNADATKQFAVECSGVTAGQTRTWTVPDASDTFVGLAVTQTLTNKTLTSPRVGTSILDTNGNELFLVTATASAVNEITYANAATGSGPTLTASGGDSNIPISIIPKGTGNAILGVNSYTKVEPGGRVLTRAGNGATASSDDIAFSGMYFSAVPATAPTSGSVTTTIKTVAANVLGKDGDWLEVHIWGTSPGANNKQIALWVAGNAVVTCVTYTANETWHLWGQLRRDTSTNFDAIGHTIVGGAVLTGEFFSSSWNFAASFDIQVRTVLTTASSVSINRVLIVKHTTPA